MNKDEIISYIVCNKWRCKDGTVLNSHSRHDYITHTDAIGEFYFLDGGLIYIRHSGNMECMCVYSTDPHDKIRDNFEWGSYGKSGKEELHYIVLKDINDDHLCAIIKTQTHLDTHIMKIFTDEVTYRSKL
jgi:hypothetical protein